MRAAEAGDQEVVDWILAAGADANARSRTPVEWSEEDAEEGHPGSALLTVLLRGWPRPAPEPSAPVLGQTALFFAAENGHQGIVEALVKARADVAVEDAEGGTALLAAAAEGHAPVVQRLVTALGARARAAASGALELAARGGHVDTVRILLGTGVNASEPGGLGSGLTPLDHAATAGHTGVVELLLQSGVRFESRGSSLMMEAIARGHVGVVRLLLAHQSDDQRMAPRNLLLLAVANGQDGIIDLLAQAGVELETADLDYRTPLRIAVEGGHVDAVRALLEAGAAVDYVPPCADGRGDGRTPLMVAAERGEATIVKILLDAGAELERALPIPEEHLDPDGTEADDDPDAGFTALMFAARAGHADATRVLLDVEADFRRPNGDGEPALGVAIRAGRRETANLIRQQGASTADILEARLIGALKLRDPVTVSSVLAAGAHPDTMDRLPDGGWAPALVVAALAGDAQSLFVLLGAGADPDTFIEGGTPPWERTALMVAADLGNADAIQALMQGGADPELTDHHPEGADRTAFMMPAAKGHIAVLKVFKRIYDKIDYRSPDGWTAVTCAAAAGEEATVRLLLEWGAEVNDERQSALREAVRGGHADVVELLLSMGADVDAQPAGGETPLMAAAAAGQVEIARQLLAAGADSGLKDDAGRDAHAVAVAAEQQAMVVLLAS
jgi:ankyrin repeat protein